MLTSSLDTAMKAMATTPLDNTSVRFDLGAWTATQLKSAVNITQYAPSAKDLLLAGPRMGMKIGTIIFSLPETIDDVLGGRLGQRVIPDATGVGGIEAVTTSTILSAGQVALAGVEMIPDEQAELASSKLSLETGRSFSNILSYSTSKWACLCILMAILLNRTFIYASTRRNLTLGWKVRFTLRIIPILMLAVQARWLLQSIQCQTSHDFSILRWGNASKSSDLMFAYEGGYLHSISSTLLLGAADAESCRAVKMVPPKINEMTSIPDHKAGPNTVPAELSGSLSLLWPLFETFCISQFVETISCAVQGRQVATSETGSSIFEQSLAFSEAEMSVSSSLGWGAFGKEPSGSTTSGAEATSKTPEFFLTRAMVMKRINTSPEILLVAFLSCMSHLTSHVLGILNMQGRLRLANTMFWGLCFMSTLTWSVLTFSVDDIKSQSLLRFPTVCIIGFVPHVLVLAGIILCSLIYGLALVLNALSPPVGNQQQAFLQRLRTAHQNLQASSLLGSVTISMHMDFYAALLKTGFTALTMASEAVYLNESGPEIRVQNMTWLELERLKEIEENGTNWLTPNFRTVNSSGMPDGVGLVDSKEQSVDVLGRSTSGFAKEKVSVGGKPKTTDRAIRDGVGATERSGRFILALELFAGILKLVISWSATVVLSLLARVGIQRRPRWLVWLVRSTKSTKRAEEGGVRDDMNSDTLKFWLLDSAGELTLPDDDHVDVECEMRKRLRGDNGCWDQSDEQALDSNLYSWWLNGGWWGCDDSSGSYIPARPELDDDTTSLVSMSTEASEQDYESDELYDDSRRTPTQHSPNPSREHSPIFDSPLSSADLARLMHPKTPEQRIQARNLAAHFESDIVLTRSRYQDLHKRQRAKVLTSTRQRPAGSTASEKLTPEEEAEILEHLIISRRACSTGPSPAASWRDRDLGETNGGPPCVICQSAPRDIIGWPCRCYCLCDECRIELAMHNFSACPTCKTPVTAYSRIFVP